MVASPTLPRVPMTPSTNVSRKDRVGGDDVGPDEAEVRQLLNRRARQQLDEQRRQRNVHDERVQPAQRLDRLAGDARGNEADHDQPEQRQDQSQYLQHLSVGPTPGIWSEQ
jgi:hypothetical protein